MADDRALWANDMDDDRADQRWLCEAGHVHEDGLHCHTTSQEPPWGCPCSGCQEGEADADLGAYWEMPDAAAPCPYCGEGDCERSCTGAILADQADAETGEEADDAD
jgi:hypothetical protein